MLSLFCKNDATLSCRSSRAILQADHETQISDWTKDYTQRVAEQLVEFYGLDVVDLSGTALRNWYPGEKQHPHSDCEAVFYNDDNGEIQMTKINNFSSIFIEYAALTYLNDDYSGGEIYFPDFDLEIKPRAGELIFFPGTQHYMHGVKEILSGNRYVFMTFFTSAKIKYIWKTFVQDTSQINITERTELESTTTTSVFTRKNMPKSLINHFQ